jgi:hypothetical protein
MVVQVGANVVAVKFSNRELPPFWGYDLRFAVAAGIFAAIVAARRDSLPSGRALVGAALYADAWVFRSAPPPRSAGASRPPPENRSPHR